MVCLGVLQKKKNWVCELHVNRLVDRLFQQMSIVLHLQRSARTFSTFSRKPGVASPVELEEFVKLAGKRLVVVDVRNPDLTVEPKEAKSIAVAPIAGTTGDASYRPQSMNLVFDRVSKSMPLPPVEKDTPIITHCGSGGRGQKAKDFLIRHGFLHVLNGGGPQDKECWATYGQK